MKVFISWSREDSPSHRLAQLLRGWLPRVIQAIQPWVSSEDLSKGGISLSALAENLDSCGAGILCVTRDSQRAPWLVFEAGLLCRSLDDRGEHVGSGAVRRVCPVLLDMAPADLDGPLSQFQATVARDKEDMRRLISSLNGLVEVKLEPESLESTFEKWWPDFERGLRECVAPVKRQPIRSERELLEEVLNLVRDMHRRADHGSVHMEPTTVPGPNPLAQVLRVLFDSGEPPGQSAVVTARAAQARAQALPPSVSVGERRPDQD